MSRLMDMAVKAKADFERHDPAPSVLKLRVRAMLAANPETRYAVATDATSRTDVVLVAFAVRGVAIGEARIASSRYDGMAILELLEQFIEKATPEPAGAWKIAEQIRVELPDPHEPAKRTDAAGRRKEKKRAEQRVKLRQHQSICTLGCDKIDPGRSGSWGLGCSVGGKIMHG